MLLRLNFALAAILLAIWCAGCSRTPLLVADVPPIDPLLLANGARADLIRETWKHIGTPYRYGGASPRGFDCSGLVHYVHRKVGIDTPRTTAAQRPRAQQVALNALQTGDLLFFSINGEKGRHVAIYEGNGVFIHAPSSGKLVSRASLSDPYWRTRIVGAGSYF